MKRQTIAIDVDDVLASFADDFVAFTNDKWGTHLTIEDYAEHWGDMWQVEFEEEKRRIGDIFKSDLFKNVKPFADAKDVLSKLSKRYKLVVLTSREKNLKTDTIDWINHNYKDIFDEIHFSGLWDDYRSHGNAPLKLTKTDRAREIGADYLIDDLSKHCLDAASAGIESLLFGDYHWNQVKKLPKGVTRVHNWHEVLEFFNAKG